MSVSFALVERGIIPDALIRKGIRWLNEKRLAQESQVAQSDLQGQLRTFSDQLRQQPLAVETDKANEQHYEVPSSFFLHVLGPRLKYSCGYYETGLETLDQAEIAALKLTCEHAGISDGQDILELGCGWGSLALWIAEHYPHSRILTISNSHSQREFILSRARQRGLSNLDVRTHDINNFEIDRRFDRVVSVEMFEHLRNYEELFSRIAHWLKPDGQMFCHIFCHRRFAYLFETTADDDWMGKHFFTGGMMPAEDLFLQFQKDIKLRKRWWWNGNHYARTSEHWLKNLDRMRAQVLPVLVETYSEKDAVIWLQRWRIFFMACAELFAYSNGEEWGVCHYLFERA